MKEVLNVTDVASEDGTAQKEGEKISFFEFIFGCCFKKAKKKVEEFTLAGVIMINGAEIPGEKAAAVEAKKRILKKHKKKCQ